MDKVFLRNFVLLLALLACCISVFVYTLFNGERTLSRTDDLVVQTYGIITRGERLSSLIESMLANQRGYALSGREEYLKEYQRDKARVSELIASISGLVINNAGQTSRLEEMRHHINNFSDRLEERARDVAAGGPIKNLQAEKDNVTAINDARLNIQRINEAILREEYNMVKAHVLLMEQKKKQYFNSLLSGGLVGGFVLLLINGFLFQSQSRRSRAEKSLAGSEQRFALASEGTNDGIFDWDIKTGEVYYSKQFFGMLGYEREAFTGLMDDSRNLIHPDDLPTVREQTENYVGGVTSEYNCTYRVKHINGYWVWINSRAKAVFDREGRPARLVGVNTDITFMVEAQRRLEEEKNAAENANRAKSDFLAHMSHEIRTPLTAIAGIAEILEKKIDEVSEGHRKLIRTLGTSTSSLKDLINDILDFSKIESGEIELNEKAFNLDEVFRQVYSIMSIKAQEKNIDFTCDVSTITDVNFYGDNMRLRQILINLIGNALKFSDKNGSVKVDISRVQEGDTTLLRVDVSDNGIGIAEDKFDIIFERFKQADTSVSRKYGGTGLGLPISKNLARMMGGDISLQSDLGEGSTFTLILPFRSLADSTPLSHHMTAVGLTNKNDVSQKLNDQIGLSLQGKDKVLLVEDYEGNIVVIGFILDELNIAYDIAKTGLQALDLWKTRHYNLILMDVQMPEMDGLTATSLIRKIEADKNIDRTPIIGMTAHALVADKDKCIAAGMDAYLPKPIVEADLKTEILHYLKQRRTAA